MQGLTHTLILDCCSKLSAYLETFNNLHPEVVAKAHAHNAWFTPDSINKALKGLAGALRGAEFEAWVASLQFAAKPKTVGLVLAGNLPAVGFSDVLCTLCTGNRAMVKYSTADNVLLPFIFEWFTGQHEAFRGMLQRVEKLQGYDAVIATGSNNTSRYFEHYFKNVPHIIRANRSSAAVLDGHETTEELELLSNDILDFYGMGCRSVVMLYLPADYVFLPLLEIVATRSTASDNHKYFNNYEYNKAIMLVNGSRHYDTGTLLFTESESLHPPLAVVHYSFYKSIGEVQAILEENAAQLQCVVARQGLLPGTVRPGQAQCPALADYADGINTVAFLNRLAG